MKLSIKTDLNELYICGQFCGWNIENALCVKRGKGQKFLNIAEMPTGEYRVFKSKSFADGEVYPVDKRQMPNRYFGGEANEVICCYF